MLRLMWIRDWEKDILILFKDLWSPLLETVTAKEAAADLRRSRISIKDTIAEAIDYSKQIPDPAKQIVKDRLFYRCANTILG